MTDEKETQHAPATVARHRLEVLWADTIAQEQRLARKVIAEEHHALRTVLDELHRLNEAVSMQRKLLQNAQIRKKQGPAKPAGARTQRPTARNTKPAKEKPT